MQSASIDGIVKLTRTLTHHSRNVLPARAQQRTRHVIALWGTLTSRWRMVPSLVIVGAQRSGTTTLFRMLSEHPQVVRPTASKGAAYFDLNYERGFKWYRGHFPIKAFAYAMRRRRDLITFESSGYYMVHPLAAYRIARDLPTVRVVAMLRNPVDRAHSAHRHELRRGFETVDFQTALGLEGQRISGEAERIVDDPSYQSYELQHHAYLKRGEYADQVQRLHKALGRDRVYVIDADAFFKSPSREYAQLTDWLGLERAETSHTEVWNAAPRDALPAASRQQLVGHFEASDQQLTEILGWTPSWRSADSARLESSERPS